MIVFFGFFLVGCGGNDDGYDCPEDCTYECCYQPTDPDNGDDDDDPEPPPPPSPPAEPPTDAATAFEAALSQISFVVMRGDIAINIASSFALPTSLEWVGGIVAGTTSWVVPYNTPIVGSVGSYPMQIQFISQGFSPIVIYVNVQVMAGHLPNRAEVTADINAHIATLNHGQALVATFGQTLSQVSLGTTTGYFGGVHGIIAWVNPATSVGNVTSGYSRQFSITFTPTNSNYLPLTEDNAITVNVTVNPA